MPRMLFGLVAALLVTLASATAAQETDSLRAQYRLERPPTLEVVRPSGISPGLTIGTPSAYGADFGDLYAGIAYQDRTRRFTSRDAGVFAGFGLGDARDWVGLESTVSIYGTRRSCCRGGLSFKAHRLLPGLSGVAVGWENAVTWKGADENEPATDAGTSLYAVGSKIFLLRTDPSDPFGSLGVSVGVGNGRFRRLDDILADRETANLFGSASLRLLPQAAALVEWTGEYANAGLSIVPFRRIPLFITPALTDLDATPRFVLGVAYGTDFSTLF